MLRWRTRFALAGSFAVFYNLLAWYLPAMSDGLKIGMS